jgi:acyl carrier protein
MDRECMRKALIDLVAEETDVRHDRLDDSVLLHEGLGIDSVDLISLVLKVENRFDVRIETDELMPLQRVGELLDVLEAKVASKPHSAAA